MKKILLFLMFFALKTGLYAQVDSLVKELPFKVIVDVNTGSGYTQFLGIKTSQLWSVQLHADIIHTSGIGASMYRWEDFSREAGSTGSFAFFDLFWTKNVTKNLSILFSGEYGFFDNVSDLPYYGIYGIFSWENPIIHLNIAPMYYRYYKADLHEHEAIVRLQATKDLGAGFNVQLMGWYDNLVQDKFYCGLGARKSFGKYYLQGDYLYKANKSDWALVFGATF
jgi:hypothetical protein